MNDEIIESLIQRVSDLEANFIKDWLRQNKAVLLERETQHSTPGLADIKDALISNGKISGSEFDQLFLPSESEVMEQMSKNIISTKDTVRFWQQGIINRDVTESYIRQKLNGHQLGLREILKCIEYGLLSYPESASSAWSTLQADPSLLFKLSEMHMKAFGFKKEEVAELLPGNNEDFLKTLFPVERIPLPFDIDFGAIPLILDPSCTNVMLLGTTGSGKTILLSGIAKESEPVAILRPSAPLDVTKYYKFMRSIPRRETFLDTGTAEDILFNIPLNLRRGKKGRLSVDLNLIELAGEDFKKFEREGKIPEKWETLLSDENHNIIFFIIDYSVFIGDSQIALDQQTQLEAAFRILQERGVFRVSDQINLVVSKWDATNDKYKSARELLNDPNNDLALAIMQQIEFTQKDHGVSVDFLEFSIGESEDEATFKYDPYYSREFVKRILENAAARKV